VQKPNRRFTPPAPAALKGCGFSQWLTAYRHSARRHGGRHDRAYVDRQGATAIRNPSRHRSGANISLWKTTGNQPLFSPAQRIRLRTISGLKNSAPTKSSS
jgi:hypothetical protein